MRRILLIVGVLCLAVVLSSCDLFGPSTSGVIYSISGITWKNQVDDDGDDYTCFRELELTVTSNIDSSSYSIIYAELYYRESGTTSYSLYHKTDDITLAANRGENIIFYVGLPKTELSNGNYDFKIELYEKGKSNVVTLKSPDNESDFASEKFETSIEDVLITFSIENVSWDNIVDNDNDGYSISRNLIFDITTNQDSGEYSLLGKLYYKAYDEYTFQYYSTTNEIIVSGTNEYTSVSFPVNEIELNYSYYDFMFELFYPDNTNDILDVVSAPSISTINDVKFEQPEYEELSVRDVWWSNEVDNDGDGYTRSRKLYVDVDISSGTETVYFELLYRSEGSSSWYLYSSSNEFRINTDSDDDTYIFDVYNINSGTQVYDFKIYLYRSGNEIIQMTLNPEDDIDLNNESFEKDYND